MRVFITGATGFIGSAVVSELVEHGHHVLGLARSEASAEALRRASAEPVEGSLEDLAGLSSIADSADAVIHLGFNHDFSRFLESCAHDARVVEALATPLVASDRLLLVTSGTAILPPNLLSTEQTAAPSGTSAHPRAATELACDAATDKGAKVAIVRMSPSVHGEGDRGFVSFVADFARTNGVSPYIGEGSNRWNAVHRLDAARLFRLALERGTGGVRYHGVAEGEVAFKSIAEAIGRQLNLPSASLPPDRAAQHFTWFTDFASLDVPASSEWTRETLGWQPTHPTILSDIEAGVYGRA